VVVWLYEGLLARIPPRVRRRLEVEDLGISPFGVLELGFLHQAGAVRPSPRDIISELGIRLGLVVADISASAVCNEALALAWTRDPIDRLIAAHAICGRLRLITADQTIRSNLPLAWWAD
jgi:PIN domain nuclease of toxin-antitoxin system